MPIAHLFAGARGSDTVEQRLQRHGAACVLLQDDGGPRAVVGV